MSLPALCVCVCMCVCVCVGGGVDLEGPKAMHKQQSEIAQIQVMISISSLVHAYITRLVALSKGHK